MTAAKDRYTLQEIGNNNVRKEIVWEGDLELAAGPGGVVDERGCRRSGERTGWLLCAEGFI